MKKVDLTGKVIGNLTVIKQNGKRGSAPIWTVRCICGKEKDMLSYNLLTGKIESCGCRYGKINPTGKTMFNALFLQYKFGAKKRKLLFEISKEDFMIITRKNCYYCNTPPSNIIDRQNRGKSYGSYVYSGLDRKDSNKGYTNDNVVPSCKICNREKSKLTLDEYANHIIKVYNCFVKNQIIDEKYIEYIVNRLWINCIHKNMGSFTLTEEKQVMNALKKEIVNLIIVK